MSYDIYGHLDGVVTKIEGPDRHGGLDFEVLAPNGVTCHVTDIYGKLSNLKIGMKICLEEASIMLDNGEMIYLVDEKLRGVEIEEVAKGKVPIPPGFRSDLRAINKS